MWQIIRHHEIKHNFSNIQKGDIVNIEHNWIPTFVFLPHIGLTKIVPVIKGVMFKMSQMSVTNMIKLQNMYLKTNKRPHCLQ
jgi:hypothetical protein